jgi:hypothetical protein
MYRISPIWRSERIWGANDASICRARAIRLAGTGSAARIGLVAVFLGLSLAPGPSQTLPRVETKTIQAPTGQLVLIETLSAVDAATCESKVPAITLIEQPAHGKVDITPRENQMRKTLEPAGQHCMGKMSHGAGIYYTSVAGFHGTDRFSFAAQLHAGTVQRNITVNVQ